jgi:FkbM family methyltransferase
MIVSLSIKIARKFPAIRERLMKRVYRNRGKTLEELISIQRGKFYIYRVDGLYLPNEDLHEHVSFDELLEKARNESLFHYMPRLGDIIVDLGAGLGEESVLYSKLVGHSGKVMAVEAHPGVFAVLEEVTRLNRMENITLHPVAIGPSGGSMMITDPVGSYESAALSQSAGGIPVRTISLHALLSENQVHRIDLLKSNMEGAERYIAGTSNAGYMQKVRHVAIACHDFRFRKEGNEFFRTKDLVKQFLLSHGFDILERATGIDYLDDWIYGTNKF